MTVQVTGIQRLRTKLVRVRALVKTGDKQIMEEVGEEVIKQVVRRTRQGKDANGTSFKSYTSAYAKNKGSSVNLWKSGSMLSNMLKTASGKAVRVYISKRRHWDNPKITNFQLAKIHNDGQGDQKKREFMGLTNTGAKKILKSLRKKILKKVSRY